MTKYHVSTGGKSATVYLGEGPHTVQQIADIAGMSDELKKFDLQAWSKTFDLRWSSTGKLQQRWQGSGGGSRWEDIGTATDDAI